MYAIFHYYPLAKVSFSTYVVVLAVAGVIKPQSSNNDASNTNRHSSYIHKFHRPLNNPFHIHSGIQSQANKKNNSQSNINNF